MSLTDIALSTRIVTKNTPTASAVPSGTWTNVIRVPLCAGTYLVNAYAQFGGNANGERAICVSASNSGSGMSTQKTRGAADYRDANTVVISGTNVNSTTLSCTFVYTSTIGDPNSESDTINLNCYQNSGSSLTVYPAMYIVPID